MRGSIRCNRLHRLQVHHEREQGFNGINVETWDECGFGRIAGGDEQRVESFFARERRHGQNAVGVAHAAIQREFANDERAREIGVKLFRCQQQTNGDGEIVRGTFFAQVGWRKVNGYQSGTIGVYRPSQSTLVSAVLADLPIETIETASAVVSRRDCSIALVERQSARSKAAGYYLTIGCIISDVNLAWFLGVALFVFSGETNDDQCLFGVCPIES